jgi:hypothetical protein
MQRVVNFPPMLLTVIIDKASNCLCPFLVFQSHCRWSMCLLGNKDQETIPACGAKTMSITAKQGLSRVANKARADQGLVLCSNSCHLTKIISEPSVTAARRARPSRHRHQQRARLITPLSRCLCLAAQLHVIFRDTFRPRQTPRSRHFSR